MEHTVSVTFVTDDTLLREETGVGDRCGDLLIGISVEEAVTEHILTDPVVDDNILCTAPDDAEAVSDGHKAGHDVAGAVSVQTLFVVRFVKAGTGAPLEGEAASVLLGHDI